MAKTIVEKLNLLNYDQVVILNEPKGTDYFTGMAGYDISINDHRKDWARYVYSAKQEDTKEKRREEMKMILQAG